MYWKNILAIFGAGLVVASVGSCSKQEAPRTDRSAAATAPAAAPAAPEPQKKCPAASLPEFPWPDPPEPSITALVPRYQLFEDDGKTLSLLAVGRRLEGAIQRAGYRQAKYLGAGCKGFVIVLDLEHIEADGTRKAGTEGFAPPSQEPDFSLIHYLKRLFYSPPGYYRVIVFVVSDQRMTHATASPTAAQFRAITRDGTSSLPPDFVDVVFSPNYDILVLIYEWVKLPGDEYAKMIDPDGRLGANVHLMKAHLFVGQ